MGIALVCSTKPEPNDLVEAARQLALQFVHEEDRPGTAACIFNLAAEVEMLREAAKGQVIVVNQAAKSATLAQLQASTLLTIAEKLRPVIDDEIEQRKCGGNEEDWASLQALSDELHAAIRLVTK